MRLNAGSVALGIGIARVAFGLGLFAAPDTCLRLLGVDGSSARRMTFLARMVGARDVSLGAGAAVSCGTGSRRGWLLAGALADAGDVVAVSAAARRGTVGGAAGIGIIALAGSSAAVGAIAVVTDRVNRSEVRSEG
jgi:hypothetical protein